MTTNAQRVADIRVGVSPLSWMNDVMPELGGHIPVGQMLDEAASAGYAGIERGNALPTEAGPLAATLKERSLALSSGWHSGHLAEGTVDDEMIAATPFANLLTSMGSKVMVYGECASMASPGPWDLPMSRRIPLADIDVKAYAARLTHFAKRLLDEHGLQLAYHPHLMMVAERQDEVGELFHAVGGEVMLLLDTGHCTAGGGDVTGLLDMLGDRVAHVHLKDVRADVLKRVRDGDLSFNDGVRMGMFTVPGDGDVDFAPVASWLASSGYEGWLVVEAEQDPRIAPPVPMVTKAREFVRETFGV